MAEPDRVEILLIDSKPDMWIRFMWGSVGGWLFPLDPEWSAAQEALRRGAEPLATGDGLPLARAAITVTRSRAGELVRRGREI